MIVHIWQVLYQCFVLIQHKTSAPSRVQTCSLWIKSDATSTLFLQRIFEGRNQNILFFFKNKVSEFPIPRMFIFILLQHCSGCIVIKAVIAATDVIQPLILSLLSISRLFFLGFYVNLNPARWYINCKMVKFKTPLFVLLYGQGLEIFSFYFTA